MSAEIIEIIVSVKEKITKLNAAYIEEKRKNYELTEKINTLATENNELNSKIKKISSELETIKLSKTLNYKEDVKEEAKGQINTLIREIDNCIALINKI